MQGLGQLPDVGLERKGGTVGMLAYLPPESTSPTAYVGLQPA